MSHWRQHAEYVIRQALDEGATLRLSDAARFDHREAHASATLTAPVFDGDGRLIAVVLDGRELTAADLAALRELLRLCQEQRDLLRDVDELPGVRAREHAAARARHHWRTIVAYLEALALNVPAPGAALAGRLADMTAERDRYRAERDAIATAARAFYTAYLLLTSDRPDLTPGECLDSIRAKRAAESDLRRLLQLEEPAP